MADKRINKAGIGTYHLLSSDFPNIPGAVFKTERSVVKIGLGLHSGVTSPDIEGQLSLSLIC